MQIPQNIIDKILSEVDIIKEIGEDVTLRKQGVNYVGICPFHADKTPSMFVSPNKGIFKCFACGEGGNAITFRQKYSSMSFPEACKCIAKKLNIEVPREQMSNEQLEEFKEIESVKAVITEAQNQFLNTFKKNASAIDYVTKERNISIETAEEYGIGYADKFGISKALRSLGYADEFIIKAGILTKTDKGIFDVFRNRIMFPFYDKQGRVVGFTGRDLTGESKAKYKNTGETIIFTKGNYLYGFFQAKNNIRKEDSVYIVEGQFDVIGLANVGVKNVVGGSGTAFTEAQRKLLRGLTNNIIFIYDGDNAGFNAAKKNLPLFVSDGFNVKCIALKDLNGVKDPADLSSLMGEGTRDWLKQKETTYVEFLVDAMTSKEDTPNEEFNKIKIILDIIARENKLVQDKYLSILSSLVHYDIDELKVETKKIKVPKVTEGFADGFQGIDFIDDFVDKEKKEIHLTNSENVYKNKFGNEEPYIYYKGNPNKGAIQELNSHATTFVFHSPDMDVDARNESNDILLMKEMFMFGMKTLVEDGETSASFITYYIGYYGDLIEASNPNDEDKNEYILRCAEMISYTKPAVQTVNMSIWAKQLKVSMTVLKELVKPYTQERKAEKKMHAESTQFNNQFLEYNTTSVPSYVEENIEYKQMLDDFGYYPILNKNGEPVSYMFKTEQGFKRVADFYMEPLMHVYSKSKEENRRIIKINRARRGGSIYLEWPSSVFVKLSSVKEMLIMEEHLNFENASPIDYERIWANMSYGFTTCNELKVLGQQLEGCFCFANGIFHEVDGEWMFELSDDLGLMRHGKSIFYSPSYSVVNSGMRYDKDPYEMDKRLSYIDTPQEKRTSFEHWASLMNEVYKINDNGKWAILYAFLCAFRSEIYPIDRTFTSIFLVGQTESGKTQIAISIRSLFMSPKVQNMNLNSASDAAFFSIMEKYRDVPVVMEEYNDEEISPVKFQGLKSCIYDGDGKEKRKSASTNDIDSSAVNAPVILLGQEAPQRDDGALANRVILLQVDKKVSFSEHEQDIFNELKQYEKDGLSYILLEILKLRNLIKDKFAIQYRRCKKELEQQLIKLGKRTGSQNRLINTISFFTTACKLIEEETELKLPFTYKEFMEVAIEKISKQVDMITQSDKLGVFFSTIDASIDSKDVLIGRDFRIETVTHIKLAGGEQIFDTPTRVIYMNMKSMYDKYIKNMDRQEKPIKSSTLSVNIESSPAYIGKVKGYRFRWLAAKDVQASDVGRGGTNAINNALVRVMERQERTTSAVVMNYDMLKKVMDIDYERDVKEEDSIIN